MKKTLRSILLLVLLATPVFSTLGAEAKRVLVVTVTTGFRHSSIPFAEKTLAKIGEESKIYTVVDYVRQPEIVVPKKPNKPRDLAADADEKAKAHYAADLQKFDAEMAKWTPEFQKEVDAAQAEFDSAVKQSLEKLSPDNLVANKIDLVIFANTTGNLPLPDKEGFIKWIEDGHAFAAMHSGSDTFHQFPGYLDMLQGEFETHKAQVPVDLIAGDKVHPANAGNGDVWNLKQEEMYIIKNQDPQKVHSIWFLRHHPNDPTAAGFFPVSWCRKAGKGNVFYTSLGHREDLWSDDPALPNRVNSVEMSKQYQAHLLGGLKWVLGLAEGSFTPNPDVK